ncbi:MAG: FAD-binding protein, partial [Cyanobium sp.]
MAEAPPPPAGLRQDVPLLDFTTWRVGGPAEWFAEPADPSQLVALAAWAARRAIPFRVIGAGSNLLIADRGLPGLTICNRRLQGSRVDAESGVVEAEAGEPIPTLARKVARAGLHGLEWAVGIPGTVGGAAVMNAGAQGGCTAEWLDSVLVLDPADPQPQPPRRIAAADLDFAYRHSLLQDSALLVLSARFSLEPGHDPAAITART